MRYRSVQKDIKDRHIVRNYLLTLDEVNLVAIKTWVSSSTVKDALSGLRQFLATESPLQNDEK